MRSAPGSLRLALCRAACALLATGTALAGVGAPQHAPGPVRRAAAPSRDRALTPGSSDRSRTLALPSDYRIGALLPPGGAEHGFCTAGVVASPHHNLLVTAAHCVYDGPDRDYRTGLSFSPGDSTGHGPAGLWWAERTVVDAGWMSRADPDLDVAFVIMSPRDGRNIQDMVGGNPIAFGRAAGPVGLIGYPTGADTPHSCVNRVHQLDEHQLWIYCPDFTSGTSGSPWLADAGTATGGSGTLIGVLGGHEHGGATADVSYSSYFGPDIAALYYRAVAAS
ncbi:hypothetical protein GXW83_13495 [Streptacidiphilus sp. PB12-B1b]|uniref:trypsin-like peptidase domain-containing protein n=1 Tax=Streptacidiphilus sp. PB12-B1b TaxID=2705012 RepID=UPI0015F9BFD0|nr:trypsin-like peptidase domain-containing protein [Streptacidiphilus sp. PB12-B1b]QMU76604.1 hypothetical protein GXW83_13495 [Streptacidiphilus sp. PB12-B1b]